MFTSFSKSRDLIPTLLPDNNILLLQRTCREAPESWLQIPPKLIHTIKTDCHTPFTST